MEYIKGISVIVPVYNVRKYLRKALDSYMKQEMENMEIILIDDGSNDGSEKICDEYAQRFDQISVYHIENSGVSNARNLGIGKAKFEYIAFFDSDDYIDKNALPEMYARITGDQCDQVVCGYYMETTGYKTKHDSEYRMPQAMSLHTFNEFVQTELWEKSLLYNIWNKLYKTELIVNNQIYFKNMKLGEDLEFNLRYIECCKSISVMNKSFYHYIRERKGSATTSYISNWFDIRKEEHNRLLAYMKQHGIQDGSLIEFLHRRYIERVLGCIENEFHNKNHRSIKSVLIFIKYVIYSDEVENSLKIIKPKSKKLSFMIIPLKNKSILLTYAMGSAIAFVRNISPQLFFRLKTAR